MNNSSEKEVAENKEAMLDRASELSSQLNLLAERMEPLATSMHQANLKLHQLLNQINQASPSAGG